MARESGQAVEKAIVVVKKLPFNEAVDPYSAHTEKDGSFYLKCSMAEDSNLSGLDLNISADGYMDLKTFVPFDKDNEIIECGTYYLGKDRNITIRVIDEIGNPIPHAIVEFYNSWRPSILVEGKTDDEGYITIKEHYLVYEDYGTPGIRITAPGKAELYYTPTSDDVRKNGVPFPEVIVMKEEGIWSGVVIDQENGVGVANATILYSSIGPFNDHLTNLKSISLESGYFNMPRVTMMGKYSFTLYAHAEGYNLYRNSKNLFTTRIELKKSEDTFRWLIVDSESRKPISQSKFYLGISKIPHITDDYGYFRHPFNPQGINFVSIRSPEKGMAFYGIPDGIDLKQRQLVIPVKEIVLKRISVMIRDEVGGAVRGAKVKIRMYQMYDKMNSGPVNTDSYTNSEGTATFVKLFTKPCKICFEVSHSNFIPLKTIMLDIEELVKEHKNNEIITLEIKLQRGILFQNIIVLNGNGGPVSNQYVKADLFNEKGEDINNIGEDGRIWGKSDINGLCDMTLPTFDNGVVYVVNRPDTVVNIDYETILQKRWINLIINDELAPNYVVEGTVEDESGKPLKGIGVWIEPEIVDHRSLWKNSVVTKEDGMFSLAAFSDQVYKISFQSNMVNGVCYTAQEINGVAAGSNLTVVMKEWKGVEVYLSQVCTVYDLRKENHKVWLENEKGAIIKAGKVIKKSWLVRFLDIPDGSTRVVVETNDGIKHESDWFEVKDGRYENRISIKK